MNDDLTAQINQHSIEYIRSQIERKITTKPYFATNTAITNTVTDMDHHPYTRWFRGVYYYPDPIIMEREAGWRPIRNNCYSVVAPPHEEKDPDHCFEAACTTIFPCVGSLSHYTNQVSLNNAVNRECNVQYR